MLRVIMMMSMMVSKMDWSIEDCINYCCNMGLIDLVNHYNLINELEDLRKDQKFLTNIMLYGEDDHNE